MKEIIIIVFVIALLSGIIHTIRYSSFIDYIGTFTIAALYGLAFAGLMTIWQSAKPKNKNKRWLMLLTGAMCIFVSYLILDVLNKGFVKH